MHEYLTAEGEILSLESLLFGQQQGQVLFEDDEEKCFGYEDHRTQTTPSITMEDFDENEKIAIWHLRRHIRDFCNKNVKSRVRKEAINWLFVPNHKDHNDLTFSLCCEALSSRETYLRLRAIYQLYLTGVILRKPLPFLTVGSPAQLDAEIRYTLGFELAETASSITHILWKFPSLRVDRVASVFNQDLFKKTLDQLVKHGYVGMVTGGHLYFIGRNPKILRLAERRAFSWAREIHDD